MSLITAKVEAALNGLEAQRETRRMFVDHVVKLEETIRDLAGVLRSLLLVTDVDPKALDAARAALKKAGYDA